MRIAVTAGEGQKDIGVVVVGGDDHTVGLFDAGFFQQQPAGCITDDGNVITAVGVLVLVQQDERYRLALKKFGCRAPDPAMTEDEHQLISRLLLNQLLHLLQLRLGAGKYHQGLGRQHRIAGRKLQMTTFPERHYGQAGMLTYAGLLEGLPDKGGAMYRHFCNLELAEGIE